MASALPALKRAFPLIWCSAGLDMLSLPLRRFMPTPSAKRNAALQRGYGHDLSGTPRPGQEHGALLLPRGGAQSFWGVIAGAVVGAYRTSWTAESRDG